MMSASPRCPDVQRLESLLQDNLSSPEQSAWTEQVGDCTSCQQALDQLAAGPNPDALRLANGGQPPSDSAYWAAVADLERQITRPDPGETSLRLEVPLDFLAPSDDPSHLGRLDHFAILGIIGRGGMGVVLRGFDTHLERDVAVKVLNPALAEDETARN